jgi:putative oxidoreductase
VRLDSKPVRVTVTVLSVLLALLFIAGGIPKIIGVQDAVAGFAKYGYPDWFRVLIGLGETGGGALLLVPRLAWLGASAITIIMVGAAYTHLFRATGEGHLVPFPLLLGAIAAFIAYARWQRAQGEAVPVHRGAASVR